MSDIFTLKTIPLTPELGMTFKKFRIEHAVTAKAIVTEFSKPPTYITKLEKGEIKKIQGDFFEVLCNFITKTNNGLKTFLSRVGQGYSEYSAETKIIVNNIDELLVEHNITPSFVSDLAIYMNEHNITTQQLVDKINANEDIINRPSYNTAPVNEWVIPSSESDIFSSFIKLDIPITYINDLLSNTLNSIHYVIAEAILYALYRLGNEENAQLLADSKLQIYDINRYINSNEMNIDNIFEGLPLETSVALHEITTALKLVATITKDDGYGSKRIQQINSNLHDDLGFSLAYMSLDLKNVISKDKEQKKEFIKEIKNLIEKYSQPETGLDIYE